MFYWSKMYISQVKPGDTYDLLQKCITINIVDFECTPLKKLHSSYHLTEDATGYRLTDILEVHFLEIVKLADLQIQRDENDPVVEWMEFLDAKSKGVIEMLAEKNKDIKKAYDLLQISIEANFQYFINFVPKVPQTKHFSGTTFSMFPQTGQR